MKAITLWQPWASLIATGLKTSETRSWAAPQGLWGERIAIHAARRPMTYTDTDRWSDELVDAVCDMVNREYNDWNGNLPLGAVVATARLIETGRVVAHEECGWFGEDSLCAIVDTGNAVSSHQKIDGLGDYSIGRYMWFLDDVQRVLPVIPARGRQGFWEWKPPAWLS